MSIFGDLLSFAYDQRVALAVIGAIAAVIVVVLAVRGRWDRVLRRHPRAGGALIATALVVGIPLGWYLLSPIFIRTELVEPPVAAAAATPSPVITPAPTPRADPTSGSTATASPTATPDPTPTPWVAAAPRSGRFQGTDDFHFARGTATLSETAPGEWTIRLEDFSVRNGPDLYVYLSPDPDGYADGALEVATLKATDGSFNVPLPDGTDPTGQASVLIWCKQFSHLFGWATLEG